MVGKPVKVLARIRETKDEISTKVDHARKLLAEATSPKAAKQVVDVAHAAKVYARRAKLGQEAIDNAHAVKIEAQTLLGRFLKASPKSGPKHSKGGGSKGSKRVPLPDAPPTLADIGISKKESAESQKLVELADERPDLHEQVRTGKKKTKAAEKESKREKKAEAKAAIPANLPSKGKLYELIVSDIAGVNGQVLNGSVDWIITDPPYPKEFLPVYADLAKFGARTLKTGGSMLVMVGQSYLPEILAAMTPHIKYHWTISYLTPGGQAVQLWERKVNTFWKPVIWFTNGDYKGDWVGDVTRSDVNDNDKEHHHWGQSESGMADLIERFTYPGQLIVDPFLGGGTTGVVAVEKNRRFIGIDIDAKAIDKTKERLAAFV